LFEGPDKFTEGEACMNGERRTKQKIIILGASLFAEEVAELISEIEDYEVVGFVEGLDRERSGTTLLDLPVHWVESIGGNKDDCKAVCAVGSTKRSHFIQQVAAQNFEFATVIHPSAQISRSTSLGEGCFVSAGAIIASHTQMGSHIIVNRGSLIGHHTKIGDYVTISPGANIAGRTTIGPYSYIGMGAIIIDGISIGSNCVIGAGSVVTKDLSDGIRAVGVPARPIDSNKE
jgi:acetyltransferase EpsM